MHRDMDLIRAILFRIEEKPINDPPPIILIKGYSSDQVDYHLGLLVEAGFIKAIEYSGDGKESYMPIRLTWEGHEFLDAARNESIWNQAKGEVSKKGGSIAVDVLKALLIKLSMSAVGLS